MMVTSGVIKLICDGNLANLKCKELSLEVHQSSVLHDWEALVWHIVNSSATFLENSPMALEIPFKSE